MQVYIICALIQMDEGSEVTEDMVFRGAEFSVKIEVDQRLLVVEISDVVTADQWRGEFDPACKSHHISHLLKCTTGTQSHLTVTFTCAPAQTLRTSPEKLATSSSSPSSAAC